MGQSNPFWRFLSDLFRQKQPPVGDTTDIAKLHSRIATLEMDVQDRDKRIIAMQHEYATLNVDKSRATESAGEEQLIGILKRLVGPLSNLAALDALASSGKTLEIADILSLVRGIEKELTRVGLERIGSAGDVEPFDVAIHQRMSGGDVLGNTQVLVRIPGYRFGTRVLLKAMVSTKDASGG